MTLSRALSNAYSGLSNSAFRADVTANNIANASTPGYVRRTVISSERVTGGVGNGVRTVGVDRHQDIGVSRLRRDADASAGRADILANSYVNFEREIGTPGDGTGLFSSYTAMETSLRDLAATPESPALQNAVLVASTELGFQFNKLTSSLNAMRLNADQNIASNVQTVNDALYRLQDINGDISGRETASVDSVALEDERQRLIDTISEIIPIKDIPRDGGQVDIVTDNGVFLLAGNVKELEFRPSSAITPQSAYAPDNSGLSGLYVGDQNLTPGQGGNFSLTSGTLSGYFGVRDSVAPGLQAEIDGLAGDLITRFSDDGIDTTKAAGAPGIFTDEGGAFDPANSVGVAGRFQLNASIDPVQGGSVTRFRDGLGATAEGPSGQSEIISNMLAAMTNSGGVPTGSSLSGQFNASELAAEVSSFVGQGRIRHESLAVGATTRANLLGDAELQTQGVDTDFELQNLLLIEQSYAANARVIQTVGDMIDRLLQL